jgi:hypothetical protein
MTASKRIDATATTLTSKYDLIMMISLEWRFIHGVIAVWNMPCVRLRRFR